MTVFGTLLWIVGLVMVVGGIAIASGSPVGLVVSLVGLIVMVYAARRDYDPSRTPMGQIRRR